MLLLYISPAIKSIKGNFNLSANWAVTCHGRYSAAKVAFTKWPLAVNNGPTA